MRRPFVLLLLSAAACSHAPDRNPPARADEIAGHLRQGRTWTTDADRREAVRILCETARRDHAEALYLLLERGTPEEALWATAALAPMVLTAEDLPRIERYLAGADDRLISRTLALLQECGLPSFGPLVVRLSRPLLSKRAHAIDRLALAVIGATHATEATPAILEYLDAADANEGAALRALGSLWRRTLDAAPLPQDAERVRRSVLLLAHHLTLSAPTAASTEAMLRIMTRAELAGFLSDHAAERFAASIFVCETAALTRGFERAKGKLIHDALLKNPDAAPVARILWLSPHELDAAAVGSRLDDVAEVASEGLPAARLCDFAAARLEAQASRSRIEIPDAPDKRETRLTLWRGRRPR